MAARWRQRLAHWQNIQPKAESQLCYKMQILVATLLTLVLVSERWRTVCYVSCPHLRTLNQLPTLTHSQTKACRKSHWQKDRKVFLNIFSLESIEKAFIPLKEHFACRNRPPVILILLILLLLFYWFLRRALKCIITTTLCPNELSDWQGLDCFNIKTIFFPLPPSPPSLWL